MSVERQEAERALLMEQLRCSYDAPAWHGPNLRQALDGVGTREMGWRPEGGEHAWNIHEVTLHVADIMQKCAASLFGKPLLRSVVSDDFPLPSAPSDADWSAALVFLERSYAALESSVRTMAPAALAEISPSRAYGRT